MNREMNLAEVSDGKLYGENDLVKADCGGCAGCHVCCTGMGKSVILDPFDIFQMTRGTGKTFEELLNGFLELNVADGLILPNLKMAGPEDACSFLDEKGRCKIHAFRPGICRLFPLGRIYRDEGFWYFLQVHECVKENRSKIKVKKWLDIPNLKQYDDFINRWHDLVKKLCEVITSDSSNRAAKPIGMYLLKTFYLTSYRKDMDFYEQFDARMQAALQALSGFF